MIKVASQTFEPFSAIIIHFIYNKHLTELLNWVSVHFNEFTQVSSEKNHTEYVNQ